MDQKEKNQNDDVHKNKRKMKKKEEDFRVDDAELSCCSGVFVLYVFVVFHWEKQKKHPAGSECKERNEYRVFVVIGTFACAETPCESHLPPNSWPWTVAFSPYTLDSSH